ncbi:class I SAM-dependent methyltransferase [Lederbergia citrea]|uniref:class I SAM-dependent methyltransferase n=1 Tax=Lederbergia citrea TaxID=2833581 RepID=UPI001BC9F249|nr:class I SAM-dependent methyltransferase [Lederbergia citrea]MBS4178344.1 methyltransferase domain-containing protein [Lederbergia citrea]
MRLIDPSTLPGWLRPHSIDWYKQLSNLQGIYIYPWNSTLTEPNGESIFDEEVVRSIKNKKALDVGCGHGEYANQLSPVAKEIVGFDVTDNFIKVGKENKKPNVSFVVGNAKHGLPFKSDEFDCAYIRKGPTSAYSSLKQVVKEGGEILGLHPGDESGKELQHLFPNLFETSQGTSIKDTINQILEICNFSHSELEVINSIEYLHTPMDVLKLRCFGQNLKIYETLKEENISEITKIFEQNATKDGLPIHFSHYIVRANV